MKFAVLIDGKRRLLNPEQVSALCQILEDCEYFHEDWVGDGKGSHGRNKAYNYELRPADLNSLSSFEAVSEDFIETIRLAGKLAANI